MSYTLRGRIESRLAAAVLPLAVAAAWSAAAHAWWPVELATLMLAVGVVLDVGVYDRLLAYQPGWAALPLGALELAVVMALARALDVAAPLEPAVAFFFLAWLWSRGSGVSLRPADLLKNLAPLVLLAIGVTALVTMVLWRDQSSYKPLFGAREKVVAADVMTVLDGANIPYRLHPDTGQVLVPEKDLGKVRMLLASKGVVARLPAGLELLDGPLDLRPAHQDVGDAVGVAGRAAGQAGGLGGDVAGADHPSGSARQDHLHALGLALLGGHDAAIRLGNARLGAHPQLLERRLQHGAERLAHLGLESLVDFFFGPEVPVAILHPLEI